MTSPGTAHFVYVAKRRSVFLLPSVAGFRTLMVTFVIVMQFRPEEMCVAGGVGNLLCVMQL